MRTAAVLVFCLVALQCFSQNNEAIILYNKGVKAFNSNDLEAAESFFTRSAKLEPHKDTYYNLAMVKDKLKDSCGYCVCLRKAGSFGDTEAKALYDEECETTDTVFYKRNNDKDAAFFYTMNTRRCSSIKFYRLYKKNTTDGTIEACCIVRDNDVDFQDNEEFSPDFEIDKVPPENISFHNVEEMPSYPGGETERINHIRDNLFYPMWARERGIQGVVLVSFIVEENGEITNPEVLKGIGGGCDEEVLRIVNKMPKWNPGRLCGKPVRTEARMPINFTIN